MLEKWKDIPNYEGLYQISSRGNVRSMDRLVKTKSGIRRFKGRTIKHCASQLGYPFVQLSKNNIAKNLLIHRLIAVSFLSNPEKKPIVHHKNHNKKDFSLDNLEWAKFSEHINSHGLGELNKKAKSKRVSQICLETGRVIKVWNSVTETKNGGFNYKTVSQCATGKRKRHRGFKWSYEEKYITKEMQRENKG